MAISFIGSATGTVNYSSSITVSKPASTTNGDVMIAVVGGTRSSAPSGWTLIDSANSGTSSLGNVYCYYKVASGEPSSYTFNLSGSWLACAAILTYRGVDNVTPVDMTHEDVSAVGATSNYTTATITAGSNTWALSFANGYEFGSSSTRTFSEGSGTERVDFSVSNSASPDNTNLMVCDSNGTISAGSFSRTQTRSTAASGGVRGIILLNVANVSGSANTATAGVDVTAYNPIGQTGIAAAAPKASVTATAFNPASVFAGHFAFPGVARVSVGAFQPQETKNAAIAVTAFNALAFMGTPSWRTFIVNAESRVKAIPTDTRTVAIEAPN